MLIAKGQMPKRHGPQPNSLAHGFNRGISEEVPELETRNKTLIANSQMPKRHGPQPNSLAHGFNHGISEVLETFLSPKTCQLVFSLTRQLNILTSPNAIRLACCALRLSYLSPIYKPRRSPWDRLRLGWCHPSLLSCCSFDT